MHANTLKKYIAFFFSFFYSRTHRPIDDLKMFLLLICELRKNWTNIWNIILFLFFSVGNVEWCRNDNRDIWLISCRYFLCPVQVVILPFTRIEPVSCFFICLAHKESNNRYQQGHGVLRRTCVSSPKPLYGWYWHCRLSPLTCFTSHMPPQETRIKRPFCYFSEDVHIACGGEKKQRAWGNGTRLSTEYGVQSDLKK